MTATRSDMSANLEAAASPETKAIMPAQCFAGTSDKHWMAK